MSAATTARSRSPTAESARTLASSVRAWGTVISGVRPSTTDSRGPRTLAAGFSTTTCRVTSSSNRWRIAARCSFLLASDRSNPSRYRPTSAGVMLVSVRESPKESKNRRAARS